MVTFPNFFIIGAAKSGTTALYLYMKQHPSIFMCPMKEPKFFANVNTPRAGRPAPFENLWAGVGVAEGAEPREAEDGFGSS